MASTHIDRGLLVVVEGLDRSGKSTQCQLLHDKLKEQGRTVRYRKFPDRTTPTGKMINSYLTSQVQQDDHSIHLLFSANRWEAAKGIKADIKDGVTVLVDRYSYSGAVYSAAKDNPSLSLEWAWQPEAGLPRPDLCIFLNLSPEEAAKRGGYGEERYETAKMQARVRQLFQIMQALPQFDEIETMDAGRPPGDVANDILGRVLKEMENLRLNTPLRTLQPWSTGSGQK